MNITQEEYNELYDAIDEYIIDEQINSKRSDEELMKLVHEAHALGASIALGIMLRYINNKRVPSRTKELFDRMRS